MERDRIFDVILVGILFLLFSFVTAIYVGYTITFIFLCRFEGMGCWSYYSSSNLMVAVEFLWAVISLMFIILKLRGFEKSYLKSLYIFIPAVIVIGYIDLPLLISLGDQGCVFCFVTIFGCILFGFRFSRLLPSQKEGITQNPVDI